MARDITAIVRRTMRAQKQKAVIYSVRVNGRDVVTAAEGESMTGVPATPAMNWRIGSIAFPLLATLALRLQEDGVVDLDAPIARRRPGLANADRVTLRMLLNGTAGYQDYVTDQLFLKDLAAAPFRQVTDAQLLAYAFRRRPECAPGLCWNYSHANWVIAEAVLARATGTPFATLIERRILRPAGLRHTRSARRRRSRAPSCTRTRSRTGSTRIRRVAPTTSTLAPWSQRNYYGLGVFLINSWLIQNPSFSGYAGAMGYLPSRRISIAVTSTQLPGADVDANVSNTILERVAAYLAPQTPPG